MSTMNHEGYLAPSAKQIMGGYRDDPSLEAGQEDEVIRSPEEQAELDKAAANYQKLMQAHAAAQGVDLNSYFDSSSGEEDDEEDEKEDRGENEADEETVQNEEAAPAVVTPPTTVAPTVAPTTIVAPTMVVTPTSVVAPTVVAPTMVSTPTVVAPTMVPAPTTLTPTVVPPPAPRPSSVSVSQAIEALLPKETLETGRGAALSRNEPGNRTGTPSSSAAAAAADADAGGGDAQAPTVDDYRRWLKAEQQDEERALNGLADNARPAKRGSGGDKDRSERYRLEGAEDDLSADAAAFAAVPEKEKKAVSNKKMSLRDVRKKAAAATGIHGFAKQVKKGFQGPNSNRDQARQASMPRGHSNYSDWDAGENNRYLETAPPPSSSSSLQGSSSRGGQHEAWLGRGGGGGLREGDEADECEDVKRVIDAALGFARKGELASLVGWLRKHGDMPPDAVKRADGWTLAHSAAEGGKCEVLTWAVRYSEPRALDSEPKFAGGSFAGAGSGAPRIVGGGGVHPGCQTSHGWTPAHIAAAHGFEQCCALLSDLGADLEAQDRSGARPLHSASASGHSKCVKVLAQHGCQLDGVTCDGATACYVAAGNGCDSVVRLLGELGADVNLPTLDGWTPAQIAHEMGHTKVLHALSDLVVAQLSSSTPPPPAFAASAASPSQRPPPPPSLGDFGGQQTPAEGVPPLSSPRATNPSSQQPSSSGQGVLQFKVTFEEAGLGLVVAPLGPRGDEAMVVDVQRGSAAERLGVEVGDVVVSVTPDRAWDSSVAAASCAASSSADKAATRASSSAVGRLRAGVANAIHDHEAANAVLPYLGRPVLITFSRHSTRDERVPSPLSPVPPPGTPAQPPPPPSSSSTTPTRGGSAEEAPAAAVKWDCEVCTYQNAGVHSDSCDMCGAPKPERPAPAPTVSASASPVSVSANTTAPQGSTLVQQQQQRQPAPAHPPLPPAAAAGSEQWECAVCTFHNQHANDTCEMCAGPSPHPAPSDASPAPENDASAHAAQAPPSSPAVWHEVESDEYPGYTYFLNEATGEAQWDRPAELGPADASSGAGSSSMGDGGGTVVADPSSPSSFPGDVVAWVRAELALSPAHEAELLRRLCGPDSDFGVTELSDLKEVEGAHLELLLGLVPIAKRKKFERALEVVRSTDIFFP